MLLCIVLQGADINQKQVIKRAKIQLDKTRRRFNLGSYAQRYEITRNSEGLKKGCIRRVFSEILEEGAMNGIIRTEALDNQWDPRYANQVKLLRLAIEGMFENPIYRAQGFRHDFLELYNKYRELSELDYSGNVNPLQHKIRLREYIRVLGHGQDSLIPLLARLCVVPTFLGMSPGKLARFLTEVRETEAAVRAGPGTGIGPIVAVTKEQAEMLQDSMLLPAYRIYRPIAEFLGFLNIKEQIEMAYQFSENAAIGKFVSTGWFDRDGMDWYVESNNLTMMSCELVLESARKVAEKMGIRIAMVQGPRAKSFYGVMEKYARKKSRRSVEGFIEKMDDGVGARVVLENVTHKRLQSYARRLMAVLRRRFEDAKVIPKQKLHGKGSRKIGYRGFHILLRFPQERGIWRFELQIRTMRMHKNAELGKASHAAYKSGKSVPLRLLRRYRELMELGAI